MAITRLKSPDFPTIYPQLDGRRDGFMPFLCRPPHSGIELRLPISFCVIIKCYATCFRFLIFSSFFLKRNVAQNTSAIGQNERLPSPKDDLFGEQSTATVLEKCLKRDAGITLKKKRSATAKLIIDNGQSMLQKEINRGKPSPKLCHSSKMAIKSKQGSAAMEPATSLSRRSCLSWIGLISHLHACIRRRTLS